MRNDWWWPVRLFGFDMDSRRRKYLRAITASISAIANVRVLRNGWPYFPCTSVGSILLLFSLFYYCFSLSGFILHVHLLTTKVQCINTAQLTVEPDEISFFFPSEIGIRSVFIQWRDDDKCDSKVIRHWANFPCCICARHVHVAHDLQVAS